MNKTPVSVVVITKNEASRLRDCLSSVDWAEEIIVVDDESTDGTVAIAREFTDRVYVRRMEAEGRHRNWAYAQASKPWVLSLDADERVSPELRDEIRSLLGGAPDCEGYSMPRRNFVGSFWVKHGGLYPSPQFRLFKYGVFRYDEEAEVHPQAFMKGPRGYLKGDIIHFTYRDFTDIIGKLDRQTDLEARKWFREKRKVGIFTAVRKSIDRFWKSFVAKKGYKDGVIGLYLAVNSGMYQLLTYVKYWEMLNAEKVREASDRAGVMPEKADAR